MPARNPFGTNFPLRDAAATAEELGIRPGDSVLEVGGAGNPFARADVVCDLSFGSSAQRNGAPGVFRRDVSYVEAPVEALPFPDAAFDFVYCTQVLEHVKDPLRACRELARVAKRGFVELPSRFGELLCGNPTHRWVVDREGDTLVFHPRSFVEHPLANFFYGRVFADPFLREANEGSLRNLFNHQLLFEDRLDARIVDDGGPRFDYDDPEQAARAHFSFARNTLAAGCPPEYAYVDALEAVRRRPDSVAARLLLAVYEARRGRPEAALAAIDGAAGDEAAAFRRLFERLRAGAFGDPRAIPLPAAALAPGATAAAGRPLVSVLVVAEDAALALASAESALAQDYDPVEVIVACPGPFDGGFERLRMGDRLRHVALPAGTSKAAALNRAALLCRGEYLAFAIAPERLMANHVDLLVQSLRASGAAAAHGDRILVTGEGVVGQELRAGEAAPGVSLSTVVAPRATLVRIGPIDEGRGEAGIDEYPVRLAAAVGLLHVPVATVVGRGPLRPGAVPLDPATARSRLDPLELVRDLIAAHVREEGLRARLATLERGLSSVTPELRA